MKSRLLGTVLFFALIILIVGTIPFIFTTWLTIWDPEPRGRTATVVCGSYAAPEVVMGLPTALIVTASGVSLVHFDDGYVLTSLNAPSLFTHKPSVFYLADNKVARYALVTDEDFHPCPEPKTGE